MLAQRGPLRKKRSPSAPKPEPMRRTCCPARSPKAMRCCTETARARASSGAASEIIACCHSGVEACFQILELPQNANDTAADFLGHGGDVRVGRWLTLHKTCLEVLVGAIEIDPFEEAAFEIFPPPARK